MDKNNLESNINLRCTAVGYPGHKYSDMGRQFCTYLNPGNGYEYQYRPDSQL